ncbi:2-succinyl-5-enolpyruvyl-6-hydroxy-3-cyclohexene-1-carboxylate synthase, partial [bacterium]|nr:2-succinyl-5-enolpyruvyl-6-hydroxy-3-cyclohexene-1-carboxylate synthase [bacterium]
MILPKFSVLQLPAPNNNHFWANLLVEELVRNGVTTFFVAPGSRSTPLAIAAFQHPACHVVVHYDERGTAFMALGYGKSGQKPAAWITTSGTALANGFPAIVEADQEATPMLLLTADRPPELRDT